MMRRRDFLRATLVTAGSVIVPTACSDDEVVTGACDVNEDDAFFPQSVASGDPRPDSVVLWTRVSDRGTAADLSVVLVVALDREFTQIVELAPGPGGVATDSAGGPRVNVTARAAFDHCVKVKVSGLMPATTYYYRFYYTTGESCFASRVGRTRTAPAPDADVPVRFAFVSCQDYVGRYFNAYAALARQELDVVVHLGDYIYETTGDPSFQSASGARVVTFSDEEGAILLKSGDAEYRAARSLSNYRDLYRTYRSDRALQRVHELFPMIAVWDDHEFSDDSHGMTATYHDGRQAEEDEERRKAANQAWFEYMPVDYLAGDDFRYDSSVKHPGDIAIYRDFTFGKHVHLVMTDLRSYRADHLIPEDAFPGKVVAKGDELTALLGSEPANMSPYITDIDSYQDGLYREVLEKAAPALGFDPSFGYAPDERPRTISATFVNALVEQLNAGSSEPVALISSDEMFYMRRGFAYADLGKTAFYSSLGSRYLVVKDVFDPVSRLAFNADPRRTEVMGEAQRAWFKEAIEKSTSTWTVWGNEYCLSQLAIDLTSAAPEPLNRRMYMNCDGWDGFRDQRDEILKVLAGRGNVVAITGDLHAFAAGTPAVDETPAARIVEFVGSSISSTAYRSMLVKQVESHPALSALPEAAAIAQNIEQFLVNAETKINPMLAYCDAGSHGFCVAEANAEEFVVSMYKLPESALAAPLYEEADAAKLDEMITIERFKTTADGKSELYRDEGGAWKRWNPEAPGWEA